MPHPHPNLYRRCTFPLPQNPKYQCPRPGTHHQPTLHTYYCRSHDPQASERCQVRVHWRGKGERCVEMGVWGLGTRVCEEHAARAIYSSHVVEVGAEEEMAIVSCEVSTAGEQSLPPCNDIIDNGAPENETPLHLATPIFTQFELATTPAHASKPDFSLAATFKNAVPVSVPDCCIETTPLCDHHAECTARTARKRVDSLSPIPSPILQTHEPTPRTPPTRNVMYHSHNPSLPCTPPPSSTAPSTPSSSPTPPTPSFSADTPPSSPPPIPSLSPSPTPPPLLSLPVLLTQNTPPRTAPPAAPAAAYSQCCICLDQHGDYNMRTVPGCGHAYRELCLRKMRNTGGRRRWNCGGCWGELGSAE
ncbi:hypothetical protein SVAN01_07923 [Stagonosporopsis vannaccii]|nr:hypothetical protein SVAN01_07923 [Stagonosporopsis vannaccii]